MSPIRLTALLALSVWTLALSAATTTKETRAIQTAFAEYRAALLDGDGAKAADLVSARTIAFYDGILVHALKTPREKLAKLDFISKFIVVRVRHEFTRDEISRMTGRDLLGIGVKNGWISKSTVGNIELVNIKVRSSEAFAEIPVTPGVNAFRFVKESGKWKFDLTAAFDLGVFAMKQEIKRSGLTEDQFIIRLLNILSSKEVDERSFSPPGE